jgi:hypothetical protein
MRISCGDYLTTWKLQGDWSGYDSFEVDVFLEGKVPAEGYILVGDKAWKDKNTSYWNRHNGSFMVRPGKVTLSFPVKGLYRGEAGSRNNDIRSNIDPASIVRLDLGFKCGGPGTLYIDSLRLVRESPPAGIMAFDFGPESQALAPGFTPVTWNTVYGKDRARAGLLKEGWGPNSARDDTFPTRLYGDFVEMRDNEFACDAPDGEYRGWLVYDDLGYWGGETCHHRRRSIESGGKAVWSEDRGEEGSADYLFRFEDIEPGPRPDVWPMYMAYLFQPRTFAVRATGGKIRLKFSADAPWSSRVAALVLYPKRMKAVGDRWVAGVARRNRREFEDKAVCLGPSEQMLEVPTEARKSGWWIGFPGLEDDVSFTDAPGAPGNGLKRVAAQGERVSFTFAVRPLRDLGAPRIAAGDLSGPGGTIPAGRVDARYVHHAMRRDFNTVSYRVAPETLRPVEGSSLKLRRGLTRQFWLTVSVPADAPAGTYSGEVTLRAGGLTARVPIAVEVLGLSLDEPDYTMGFYGFGVPGGLPEGRAAGATGELLRFIRQEGMNSFTGGPNIRLKGFDAGGKPDIDYGECDALMRAAREAGFTKAIQSYGGPGMVEGLHDGYVIGETGREWERKTGRPFGAILKTVWEAVREHAEREKWLPIDYEFTDEPRVLESAQAQLELMKAYREAVPWFRIGGSYSVDWGEEPLDKAIQDIFRTLVWSALNTHGEKDMEMGRQWGREVFIYNQGTSRYSFGAYQWSEMMKGVRGRTEWHLLALHGYQFFDLDGREPDIAMVNWGRRGLIPTLRLARCREGADDFRWAVTLRNRARRAGDTPQAKKALEWLEGVNRGIKIGQRERPADFMADEAFRETCASFLREL